MKKISLMVATYNEVNNIGPMCEALCALFQDKLKNYDYEIVIIDNNSTDGTRDKIRLLCHQNPKIKAILNVKNFGALRSAYYGLIHTTGDCAIKLAADFQDPIEMIPQFVEEWEKGYQIVIGVKTASKESKIRYFLRSCYYKLIKKFSDVEQIEHFTGFGLYDRKFLKVCQELDDPIPYFRGIVAELGGERKEIAYTQPKRRSGKSKFNWYALYDTGMLGITSYTKIFLRLATMAGFLLSIISLCAAVVFLILKLIFWSHFPTGIAPILISLFFLSAIQLFFIGLLGEYILNINTRVLHRPLVVEAERLNFGEEEQQ